MRDRGVPDYEPPAPEETLLHWMSSTSADWMESQPTLWLPAVPPAPATPADPVGPASHPGRPTAGPSIPRQRTRHSTRRQVLDANHEHPPPAARHIGGAPRWMTIHAGAGGGRLRRAVPVLLVAAAVLIVLAAALAVSLG